MALRWKYLRDLCAFAASLLSPFAHSYVSPLPLPKGVRALAYVYGYASDVDSNINSEGLLEDLAGPLNRSVSLEELAKSEPDLLRLQNILQDLDPAWVDQVLAVNLYSDVSVFESRKVTGFMFGLTDRFSAGFVLPYIKRDLSFSFDANIVNNAGAIASSVGNIPDLQEGLQRLKDYPLNTQTFTQAIFLDRGYNAPRSSSIGVWGDLEVETRYSYYFDTDWCLGFRGGFRAPTSSYEPDIRNLLERDLTENTWAIKASHLSEYQIVPYRLSWSTLVGTTVRLPKQQTRAYALTSNEVLPDLRDPRQIETVSKTIGPEINAETGLQASFFGGVLNLMGSYFYTQKAEDFIEGARGLDYARETNNTAAMSHGMELALELSTFAAYQRNSFFIPFKISTAYVRPLAGRNTVFAPYWRLDSVLLF